MSEDRIGKARAFFLNNLGFILVTVVVVVYLFRGLILLDETGKNAQQILIDSAIAWVVGFTIGRMLELQGFLSGDKAENVKRTKELHAQTTISVSKDIEVLDKWCEEQTALALKVARTQILSDAGLKYHTYFTDDGEIIDEALEIPVSENKIKEERNKAKRKAIHKAVACKITPLTTNSLTTSYQTKKHDPYNFGKTKAEYSRKSTIYAAIQKIILGVSFGYYGVKLIEDFSWGLLIYTGIQTAIFLVIGGIALLKAYIFVTEEQREAMIKKINNLEKFRNTDKSKYRIKEAATNGNDNKSIISVSEDCAGKSGNETTPIISTAIIEQF